MIVHIWAVNFLKYFSPNIKDITDTQNVKCKLKFYKLQKAGSVYFAVHSCAGVGFPAILNEINLKEFNL